MAKTKKPGGAPGGSPGIRELVAASKQQVDLLNRLLAVARFGPQAGGGAGGGLPGRAGTTPEARAQQTWEDRQRQLYDRAQAFSQIGLGSIARGISGTASFAQGMESLGVPGAALLQRFAGPVGVARAGLDTAARAAPILHDSFLTDTQKLRGLARLLPGGETLQGYYDAFSGREDAFARADLAHQQRSAFQQGELQRAGFDLGFNPQQAALEARARGLAGASPVLEGRSDRSTAVGEKEFQDKQRRLPIEREIAKAERETAVAAAQRVASEKELSKIQDRGRELQRDQLRLQERLTAEESGPRRREILDRLKETETAIAGVANLRRDASQSLSAAQQAESQSRYRVGLGRVQLLQADAGDLEEDAARSAAGAQRLGGMNRFNRARAVQALQNLQRFGPEAIFPEQLSAAQSIAPQTVAKILERHGAGTGEFGQLQNLAPADYAGDPEELRRRAAEKRDEAVRLQLELEKTVAESAAESGRRLGEVVRDAMRETVDAAIRTIKTDLLRGKSGS